MTHIRQGITLFRRALTTLPEIHVQVQRHGIWYVSCSNPAQGAPISLMIGWLNSTQRKLRKHIQLHLDAGHAVVGVTPRPHHLVSARHARDLASTLVHILNQPEAENHPLALHVFSLGGYLWANILMEWEKPSYRQVVERMMGQIVDSPVDIRGIPKGGSFAITQRPLLQSILKSMLSICILPINPITRNYWRASKAYHEGGHIGIPTTWFVSTKDPISPPEMQETVINKWKACGMDVEVHYSSEAEHIQFALMHPEEYKQGVLRILNR